MTLDIFQLTISFVQIFAILTLVIVGRSGTRRFQLSVRREYRLAKALEAASELIAYMATDGSDQETAESLHARWVGTGVELADELAAQGQVGWRTPIPRPADSWPSSFAIASVMETDD